MSSATNRTPKYGVAPAQNFVREHCDEHSGATCIVGVEPSFIGMCTHLDRAMQHRQATREPLDRIEQSLRGHSNESTHSRHVPSAKSPAPYSSRPIRGPRPRPASPPRSHCIADLLPAVKEVRYSAMSERYGVPAFRPGQSLSEAVSFNCDEKGHLESKRPANRKAVIQQLATASISHHTATPALHTSPSEVVQGSQLECSFFTLIYTLLSESDFVLTTFLQLPCLSFAFMLALFSVHALCFMPCTLPVFR